MIETGLLIAVALLIALIGLDQSAVAQVAISQPLVGGWLLGAALGQPLEGMTAGALLQVLCLTELPVGASIPPDGSLAGLVGAALFLIAPRPAAWGDGAMLGAVVLLFFPLAWIGRLLEILIRRSNRVWTSLAERHVRDGASRLVQFDNLGGAIFFFAKAFLLSWTVLRAWSLWGGELPWLSPLGGLLSLVARATPFVALGVLAARYGRRRTMALAAAAFVIGFLISWRLP